MTGSERECGSPSVLILCSDLWSISSSSSFISTSEPRK